MRANEFSTEDLTDAFTLGGHAVQAQTAPGSIFLRNAKKGLKTAPYSNSCLAK